MAENPKTVEINTKEEFEKYVEESIEKAGGVDKYIELLLKQINAIKNDAHKVFFAGIIAHIIDTHASKLGPGKVYELEITHDLLILQAAVASANKKKEQGKKAPLCKESEKSEPDGGGRKTRKGRKGRKAGKTRRA